MHRLQLRLDMVTSGDSRPLIVQTRCHAIAFYARTKDSSPTSLAHGLPRKTSLGCMWDAL
jgi:hypothetical protein